MTGDVFARAYVRWMEIQCSIAFIRGKSAAFPEGPLRAPVGSMKPDHFGATLVEGWRGEICHAALTDEQGHFARYKFVDPSFFPAAPPTPGRSWTAFCAYSDGWMNGACRPAREIGFASGEPQA